MRALISGQAGVAVFCDAGPRFAVSFDAPEETLPCHTWADVRALLASAHDVIDLPDTTREAAVAELDLAWANDRALQLTLVLLDRAARPDTRAEAAACVAELFAESFAGQPGAVETFVAQRLASAPPGAGPADLPGAIALADGTAAVASVSRVLRELKPA